MDRILLVNGLKTPDGTILISHFVHDYVEYTDKNGEWYMIDGGPCEYGTRTSLNKEKATPIKVYSDDSHELIREYLEWGTYGKSGKEPYKLVPIKSLELDHINAILTTQHQIKDYFREILKNEIKYRENLK